MTKKLPHKIISAEPQMQLRRIEQTLDEKNNAALTWEWPQSREIKLLFIFEWTDDTQDPPSLEELLAQAHPHDIVTRDLAASFTKTVQQKSRFITATAFFNDDKGISICQPANILGWLHKKVNLKASVNRKSIPLSRYEKATLRVISDDPSQMETVTQILKYAIYEQGRKIGEYPLDTLSCSGACGFFVQKDHSIKFILDENFNHLFNLNR